MKPDKRASSARLLAALSAVLLTVALALAALRAASSSSSSIYAGMDMTAAEGGAAASTAAVRSNAAAIMATTTGYSVESEEVEPGMAVQYQIRKDGERMSMQDFYAGLRSDPALAGLLTQTLSDSPFSAFFWETPPASRAHMAHRPFEFVLVNAPRLSRVTADSTSFEEQLWHCDPGAGTSIATFTNLGGDSTLCSPCEMSGVRPNGYAHLANFLRSGPKQQIAELWMRVGQAVDKWTAATAGPVWVSTSGYVRLSSASTVQLPRLPFPQAGRKPYSTRTHCKLHAQMLPRH